MTKPTYKEREKRRREREILLNARRLIYENGFDGFNMDDLADAVGISKPTLYQHFKSKDDLIVHATIDCLDEVEEYLLSATETSPLDRLKTALRLILLNRYGIDGSLANFETELITSTLLTHTDAIVVKKRIMAEVNRVIDEGKARGEILPTISTPLIDCLFFKFVGLPAALKGVEPTCLVDGQDLASIIDNVIGMFERSIALPVSVSDSILQQTR